MTTTATGDLASYGDLVDDDDRRFQVHTRAYGDPGVFDAEMRHIFERSWVYVGHASEIPDAGDYKTASLGIQPVIVSRHADGDIHVLFNRCTHRAAAVCREDIGHSNYFRCPYHNWIFGNDGKLVGIPQASGYPDDLDKSELGLKRARMDTYRGLIFATAAADGPPLDEHLAPVKRYIDAWFNRSPVGTASVVRPAHLYPYKGNWKFQAENGNDGYHGNYVHESWQKVVQRRQTNKVREIRQYREDGRIVGLDNGHSLLERPGTLNPSTGWTVQALMERYPEYGSAMTERYSSEELEDIYPRRFIYLFPNAYLFDTHIRLINPLRYDRTEVHLHVVDLDGVPAGANKDRYRTHEQFFGPAGMGSPDDLQAFEAVQTGIQARAVDWLLLSRGQHREIVKDGERISHTTDETSTRSLYRQWKLLMSRAPDPGSWR
ncbi:MAG: Rieske 2Fe-2S domain-containing protein [Nocardioidaceae bacterium]|nr:Rieske 2Fe-2S domain-containing protein [Nocardioidaceae bacterium]MBA3622359.1 Rieske 2Fe-2S domain-containing protein [Euzebyales bacterium]MDQ3342495.1 Rieske 2Fe-2S domain-containing protein [Actinomycetota bacterium]